MKTKPIKERVAFKGCKSKDRSELSFNLVITDEAKEGEKPNTWKFDSKFGYAPSPDLTKRLDKLVDRIMEGYGFEYIFRELERESFKLTAKQKKTVAELKKRTKQEIFITGVSYLGSNNTGATVKATFDGKAINQKIYFENPDYGEDMEQLLEEIADEVYEYVYNDKHLQLSAFDDEDDQEEPEEPKKGKERQLQPA